MLKESSAKLTLNENDGFLHEDSSFLKKKLTHQKQFRNNLDEQSDKQKEHYLLEQLEFSSSSHNLNFKYIDNINKTSVDLSLFRKEDILYYCQLLFLPFSKNGEDYTIAITNTQSKLIMWLKEYYGDNTEFILINRENLLFYIKENFKDHLDSIIINREHTFRFTRHQFKDYFTDLSINGLRMLYPQFSSSKTFQNNQWLGIILFIITSIIFLIYSPFNFFLIFNAAITFYMVINFVFKATLTWFGSHYEVENKVTKNELDLLTDHELPIYTILVPMYKEPEILPILVQALKKMDYPQEKLDIKLVLEEDDLITQEAAKKLNLPDCFKTIIVPNSYPKTKPKACNYALSFARGEYLTIYDAEDKPEPDQLKKAVICFKKASENTACLQAKLNYYNAEENWLTRMFTLEYSLWFDFFLPALEYLGIPIPLGGTSNHFKLKALQELNGWDPFNVTEDADLGIRFSQLGYTVEIFNSTTFEEANADVGNWIRQRSRWIKGYMQTFLVHMRSPLLFYKKIGHVAFFSFCFFIGGTFFSALATPILYSVFAYWLLSKTTIFSQFFPPILLAFSLMNFLFGNSFFIYLGMLGVFKRKYYKLIPYCLTIPFYWILMSVAAYKGLWQLIYKPFYWEKTHHNLSKITQNELKKIIQS